MESSYGPSRWLFTGHERDKETGLDYMLARYAGSTIARFLAVDPAIGSVQAGAPVTWNRYSYVFNHPTGLRDPSGANPRAPRTTTPPQGLGPGPGADTGYNDLEDNGGEGVADGVREFGSGLWEAVVEEVNDIASTLAHPIQTAEGVGSAVSNLGETAAAIGAAIEKTAEDFTEGNSSQKAKIAGKVVGGIAVSVIATKGLGKLAKLGKARAITKAASATRGAKPLSMSPVGAGRRGAFREAKRQSGVPVSQQPTRVAPNVDGRGNLQPGRIYEFETSSPGGGRRTVTIRDDAAGHGYGPGDVQNRGSHFNDNLGNHYDY